MENLILFSTHTILMILAGVRIGRHLEKSKVKKNSRYIPFQYQEGNKESTVVVDILTGNIISRRSYFVKKATKEAIKKYSKTLRKLSKE